jgi:hypothetical protein
MCPTIRPKFTSEVWANCRIIDRNAIGHFFVASSRCQFMLRNRTHGAYQPVNGESDGIPLRR